MTMPTKIGAELKKKYKELLVKGHVQMNDNIVGIDSAIFMQPYRWGKASGHVDALTIPFPIIKIQKKYRADVFGGRFTQLK